MRRTQPQQGAILITILLVMVFLTSIIFGSLTLAGGSLYRAKSRIMTLQAQYAAESGVDVAIAKFNDGDDGYAGATSPVTVLNATNYRATFTSSVAAGSSNNEKLITAIGKVYRPATATNASYTRKIRVVVQRSSIDVAKSLMARNIIYIASGVKNLYGKDVHANNFIYLNKNTTNLIAENITVAGRNTGSGNCSLEGSGNLVKPSSFSDPTQTKTNVITAYNNCVSPPGNTSNADFNVQANESNVSKIASTYIPWSQYVETTQNRTCNDWSADLIPLFGPKSHTIPAAGTLDTHYPDSGSGLSASCGLLGDVYLGSDTYTLNSDVHIRGSLCVIQLLGCSPTFNNPDPNTIRWVFVEGAIAFNKLTTTPGSGPIMFVTYGGDPLLSQLLVCPYGASIYLGNSGTTSAPAAYLLATNSVCIYKTKFSSSPALGGISAKNIYIDSNPGTPFDLKLNPDFPTSSVPVDLSWRAVRYERL